MRHLSRLWLAVVFAVTASDPAGAVLLTLQGSTFGISIGALPPIVFPQVAPVAIDVSSAGGGFTEPAAVFSGSVMLPTALFTGVALIDGLTIANVANEAKTISPSQPAGPRTALVLRDGGGLGGPGPIAGTSFVNVLSLFNLAVPLGVIGSTGASTMVTAGTLMVAVSATGWTTNLVQITQVTSNDVNEVTVNFEGYDNRTAGHAGVIQLVSPFHITTNAAGNLPGLAVQTLTFGTPEPGTLLLAGAALGTVALLAYRRMRR
jgi:hypothetical protein